MLLWRMAIKALLIFLPLSIFLLIPFLKQNEKNINFLKKNIIVIIGLISVFGIYYWPESTYMFVFYPGWEYSIFAIFFYLKYLIFVLVFVGVLIILNFKKYNHPQKSNIKHSFD